MPWQRRNGTPGNGIVVGLVVSRPARVGDKADKRNHLVKNNVLDRLTVDRRQTWLKPGRTPGRSGTALAPGDYRLIIN